MRPIEVGDAHKVDRRYKAYQNDKTNWMQSAQHYRVEPIARGLSSAVDAIDL